MRDVGGSFVATIRYAIRAPYVRAAEAVAFLKGCEFGIALGLRMVIVKYDSYESICSFQIRLKMADGKPTLI